MKMLYYEYFSVNDRMQLSNQLNVYDSQKKSDRNFPSIECVGRTGFNEYKGFLYRNGSTLEGLSTVNPLILDIVDLQSIIDFRQIPITPGSSKTVRIIPFGDSFLLGFDTKIIQIDFAGKILQELLLPTNIVGNDCTIVQFEN